MELMTLSASLTLDTSSYESKLQSSQSKLTNVGKNISAWTVAKGKLIGDFVQKAAGSVVNFVSGSVREGANFDKAMSQVAATMGRSTDSMGEMAEFARKMGQTTAFSATEAAEALNYMALAGYDDEKAMSMLPKVLDLAAAGGIGLASASDMVTDASSALGLSMEQTEKLVDQMAKTSSKSNTSVAQLGEAILSVGGTAKMMKGGTTELNAVLGVLADNGVKGSEGGRALRNILLSLSAPTDQAAKQIKKLGVQIFDSEGNMRELPNIMNELNLAMEGMTQEEKTNILSEIFNRNDMKSINALLGTTNKRWVELVKEITDSKDAAKEMAETQLDNLPGDVTKFKSALSEAKIAIAEGLSPTLRDFVQGGTRLLTNITDGFKEGGLQGAVNAAKSTISELVNDWKESDNPLLNTIANVVEKIQDGLEWLSTHKTEAVEAVTAIGVAFTGVKIGTGVLKFMNLLNGATAGMAGATAGASWGASFVTKALAALGPLAVFGITLFTPSSGKDEIGDNTLVDENGKLTTEGKKYGYTQDENTGEITAPKDEPINFFGEGSVERYRARIDKDRPALEEAAAMFGEATADSSTEGVSKLLKNLAERYKSAFEDMEDEPVIESLIDHLSNETGDALSSMLEKLGNGETVDPMEAAALVENIQKQIEGLLNVKPLEEEVKPKAASDSQTSLQAELDKMSLGVTVHPSLGELQLGLNPSKNAKGEWNVPYDNYPALLHRGERILTASQARQQGNPDNNTSLLVNALQGLRNDFENMKLVVGKKTFGRAMVDYGGSRMDSYIGGAENRFLKGYGE